MAHKTSQLVLPDPKRVRPAYPTIPASAISGASDLPRVVRFAVGLVTTASVHQIPANARVIRSRIEIGTAYPAGTTLALTVGATSIQTAAEVVPQRVEAYEKLHDTLVAALGAVTCTVTGAPGVGASVVVVEYVTPSA